MSPTISVLLVDDHAVVREGYRRLLEQHPDITVAGEAATAAEASHRYTNCRPDVVVMDIALPGISGIEALRRILSRDPNARVLMFSMYEDAIFPARALQAGARGYLTKASAPDTLVEAVRVVARGKRYLSHDVAQILALTSPSNGLLATNALSAREFEILRLLVRGRSLAEIAEAMALSHKTVANYQSSIKQKLGADSHAQLFRIAIQLGLLPETREPPAE